MPNASETDRIDELERRIMELEQQLQPRIKELKSQVQLLSRELRQRRSIGTQIVAIASHAWAFRTCERDDPKMGRGRTIEELPVRQQNMMPLLLEKWAAIKKVNDL